MSYRGAIETATRQLVEDLGKATDPKKVVAIVDALIRLGDLGATLPPVDLDRLTADERATLFELIEKATG